MLTPDLSSTAEIDRLTSKIHSLCNRLLPHKLPAALVRRFLLTMCRPSISYSAPVSTIEEQAWRTIQQRLHSIVLQKLNFSRHTPRAIIHAPVESGGLDLPDGYSEQGTQHVLHLIKHVRSKTTVGHHLLLVLKWTHQLTGYIHHPLSSKSLPFPYVFSPWVDTTRQFLVETNCSISTDLLPPIKLQRINDMGLMDYAYKTYGQTAVLTL